MTTNQKAGVNFLTSESTILSPAPASASPKARSPCLSIAKYTRLHNRLNAHRPAATQSAASTPNRLETDEMPLKLNRVPSRAIVNVTPKESANSLPRNQRARIALCATISDSDPAPKMNRPTAAIVMLGARATTHAPATTRAERIRLASRVPIRSIIRPERKTQMIAATLYHVYSLPIAAWSACHVFMRVGAIAPMLS